MRPLVLLAVGAIAACGSGEAGGGGFDGEWQLVSGTTRGEALLEPRGAVATLELTGGEARGIAFCNHWFATTRADATSLAFDGSGSTEMGCGPDVMAAESAFLRALGEVRETAFDGDELVLTGEGVERAVHRGRASRRQPARGHPLGPGHPGRRRDGVGRPGRAGSGAAGRGAVEGSTGCRAVTGTWQLDSGALAVADLVSEQARCPADVERQDAHVVAVSAAGPTAEVRADRLTLTADDGRGLSYRAG